MAHTPGPWTVGEPDEDGDGVTIESQQGPVAFRVIDCSANLIATAPDMLAALKGMVAMVEDDYGDLDRVFEYRQAKDVIDRAEGKVE